MNILLSSDGKTAVENINKIWSGKSKPEVCWIITAAKASSNCSIINTTLQAFFEANIHPHIYDIEKMTEEDFENDLIKFDIIC